MVQPFFCLVAMATHLHVAATMVMWTIMSSVIAIKYSKSPYNALKLDQVLKSCIEFILRIQIFYPRNFKKFCCFFFQNFVANRRNLYIKFLFYRRYFMYYTCWFYQNYIIFEGFTSIWMIAIFAKVLHHFGFVQILYIFKYYITFQKNLPLWISFSNYSCFYGCRCSIFAHDVGNLMYFLNINFYTSISYIW